MHKILIRIDDVCPTMDFEKFNLVLDRLKKLNINPLLGVVPDNDDVALLIDPTDNDFWNLIRNLQAKGCTVAMHGYRHIFDSHCRGNVDSRRDSEFAGLPLDVQIDKIRKGKEILESHGIFTDVFFAPGHSYDDNTLKALHACGFRYISDGKSRRPYIKHGIKCLPCRSGGIPKMRFGSIHTVVLHTHEWGVPEKAHIIDDFTCLLENHRDHIVDWDTFSRIPAGCETIQTVDESIYVFYQRHLYPTFYKLYKLLRGKC